MAKLAKVIVIVLSIQSRTESPGNESSATRRLRLPLIVAAQRPTPFRLKIPRTRTRRARRRKTIRKISHQVAERRLQKFLLRRVGRTWERVKISLTNYLKKQPDVTRMFLEGILDSYVELSPLLRQGDYLRPSGEAFGFPDLLYVDAAGILQRTV